MTVTHAYRAAVVAELSPASLYFVQQNETSAAYAPLTSSVALAAGTVSATLAHFSDYGVAGDLAAWPTPTLAAAEVNLHKGLSSYRYRLPLPAGPSGLAPQVDLSYSSGIVNGMAGPRNSDGGWVGIGWALTDFGFTGQRSEASFRLRTPKLHQLLQCRLITKIARFGDDRPALACAVLPQQ